MPGNNKVFISYAHADSARCVPLLSALDAWGIDYWFDTQELAAGQELSERLQQALAARDVFIRICTAEAQRSFWTMQELAAFRGLVGRGGRQRQVIFLILDPQYVREPARPGEVVIDATTQPQAASLGELGRVLGVAERRRKITRRAALGLGIVAAATIASTGTAVAVLWRARSQPVAATALLLPKVHQPTATPYAGASRLRWFFATSGGSVSVTATSAAVYALSYDGLFALNPRDGSVLWNKAGVQAGSEAAPRLDGETLYVAAATSGAMFALRASDGTQLWKTDLTTSTISSPALGGGGIYVNAGDGYVHAFDAGTGKPRWSTKIGSNLNGSSAAAYGNGRVVAGSDQDGLYALDAITGQIAWHLSTGKEISSSPAVANGVAYVGAYDGTVYALNMLDGSQVWKWNNGLFANMNYSSLLVQNGSVYGGLDDGTLFALDATTGKRRWVRSLRVGEDLPVPYGRPAADASTLYVIVQISGAYHLLALDKQSGTEHWRFDLPFGGLITPTSPVISGDTIYFGGNNGAVFAVNLASA